MKELLIDRACPSNGGIAKVVSAAENSPRHTVTKGLKRQSRETSLSCIHGKETSKACLKIQDKVQVLVSGLHKAEVKKRKNQFLPAEVGREKERLERWTSLLLFYSPYTVSLL